MGYSFTYLYKHFYIPSHKKLRINFLKSLGNIKLESLEYYSNNEFQQIYKSATVFKQTNKIDIKNKTPLEIVYGYNEIKNEEYAIECLKNAETIRRRNSKNINC